MLNIRLLLCLLALCSLTTRNIVAADTPPPAAFQSWQPSCPETPFSGYVPRRFPKKVRFSLAVGSRTVNGKTIYFLSPAQLTTPSPADLIEFLTYTGSSNEATLKTVATLYAGQEFIVDVTGDDSAQTALPLIAIAFQSTSATPINPAPVRPAQSTGRVNPHPPQPQHVCSSTVLQADTVVTVTVFGIQNGDGTTAQLISTALPQVHILDFFNISTGIVASTLRDNTFNRVIKTPSDPTKNPAVPATYMTTQGKSGQRVAPALFFTWYVFRPLDPEVPFHGTDLIPEPAVGFSLTNPGSDYFFGASSEFLVRNVQLVYGFHYGKVTELTPNQVDDPFSSTAQQTQQKFVGKAFVGVTFNIDFIKRVFGK